MKKLVSIITPCYNGEKYVDRFLTSVLNQTYNNIELIFVDDGSTDKTKDVVLSFKEQFEKRGYDLIYIYQKNAGQAAAINQGLKVFKGEFLMWIDSDDIMFPFNTEHKVAFLNENKNCGFVVGKGVVVNETDVTNYLGILQRVPPQEKDNLFEDLILENNVVFCPGIIMARKDAILDSIPSLKIFESREGQNWQLMLPLAYKHSCGYLDEIVFKCVEHCDSHSRSHRSYEELTERYNNFVVLLTETIKRIPDISDSEIKNWSNIIKKKYTYIKLQNAEEHFKICDCIKYKNELKKYFSEKSKSILFSLVKCYLKNVYKNLRRK